MSCKLDHATQLQHPPNYNSWFSTRFGNPASVKERPFLVLETKLVQANSTATASNNPIISCVRYVEIVSMLSLLYVSFLENLNLLLEHPHPHTLLIG